MTALRLASFNTLSGRSPSGPETDPDLLPAAVAQLDADVVALQEVDRFQDRSGGGDQALLAARAMGVDGENGHRFVATLHGSPGASGWVPAIGAGPHPADRPHPADGPAPGAAPGHTLPGQEPPGYGIALISRLPVRRWLAFGLGGTPGRYPLVVPGPRPKVMWVKDEPRAAVAAVLDEPRMTIACAHLSFVPGRNAVQLRRLVHWLRTLPGPHILLGDLNLPGGLPARLTGWTPLLRAATYPSPAPRLQLDHLLAHDLPAGTTTSDARSRQLQVSDHCAVSATVHLPER